MLNQFEFFGLEQCILVSEEDDEATFVEPSLRGKCVIPLQPFPSLCFGACSYCINAS